MLITYLAGKSENIEELRIEEILNLKWDLSFGDDPCDGAEKQAKFLSCCFGTVGLFGLDHAVALVVEHDPV